MMLFRKVGGAYYRGFGDGDDTVDKDMVSLFGSQLDWGNNPLQYLLYLLYVCETLE